MNLAKLSQPLLSNPDSDSKFGFDLQIVEIQIVIDVQSDSKLQPKGLQVSFGLDYSTTLFYRCLDRLYMYIHTVYIYISIYIYICAAPCGPGSQCLPNECMFGCEKPQGVGILE